MPSTTSSAVPFSVTADHIALLKRMCTRTSVRVNDPDERSYWGLFTCFPDVNKKRPFGNSGDPAASVLEELDIHPDEETGEYAPGWYGYARWLLLELPMAYEAVMQNGRIEPCYELVSRNGAYFEYKARRSLEYWKDALSEAAALPGMDAGRLVEFAMNARNETPVHWAIDFRDMSQAAGPDSWIAAAYDVVKRHLVAKWRDLHPERACMLDGDVLLGLMMGRLVLKWPGQAERPDKEPESEGG